MRLIDADALVHEIMCKWGIDPKYYEGPDTNGVEAFAYRLMLDLLAKMPTIKQRGGLKMILLINLLTI